MTRRWLSIVVVAGLSLLAFAASASAECASVLWSKVESTTYIPKFSSYSSEWDFLVARSSLATCERDIYTKTNEMAQRVKESDSALSKLGVGVKKVATVEVLGNIVSTTWRGPDDGQITGTSSLRYVCLPDTIDPRGPKGK